MATLSHLCAKKMSKTYSWYRKVFSRDANPAPLGPQQKLKEYHSLAKAHHPQPQPPPNFFLLLQEMIERAYKADSERQTERALSLYRHAVEVIQEAFQLEVPSAGLGPKADNSAAMKQELSDLHEQVQSR